MKSEIERVMERPRIPAGNGRVVYVAGPYRNKTEEGKRENIWHAIRVAVRLWELGFFVVCPHTNTANFEFYSSLPDERWLEGDLEILKRCDCVMMLKGWEESKGAMEEHKLAQRLNLEIFYED